MISHGEHTKMYSTSYSGKELSATVNIGGGHEDGGLWCPLRRKHGKLDEYAYTCIGRLVHYVTEEITCSIGKGPTHLGANFLEILGAKEK